MSCSGRAKEYLKTPKKFLYSKNYERGELAKEILKGLAVGGFIAACFVLPGFAQVITLFNPNGARDRYRVKQAMYGLEKKKFVRIYQKGGNDVVEITEQGKRKVLEYDLETMHIQPQKKWNRVWHIVMFDIPQTKKQARNAISAQIKALGMYPLQKSTFVSPYPCKDEIDFVGEVFDVRKHLIYIQATEVEGFAKLKRHFGL